MSAKALFQEIKEHKEKVQGPHFIFSAQNPKFPEKNELNLDHDSVLKHLKGAGYDAHGVQGHYGSPEQSIIIYGVSPDHAKQLHGLAAKLGQDSSIYSTGKDHEMVFHHGDMAGQVVTGSGTVHHDKKPDDSFTTLPGGAHHFTHNFNFNKGEFAKSEINLVHYSHKQGLKEINPAFKGSGVDSRTKGRDSWHPHSFFYLEGTEPESIVLAKSEFKYKATINVADRPLYDLGIDEQGIMAKSIESNQGALNMDLVHEALKEKGFFGFYNSKHPSLSNVVCVYDKVEVK